MAKKEITPAPLPGFEQGPYSPLEVVISTSTVGFPRLSNISRAWILLTPDIFAKKINKKNYYKKKINKSLKAYMYIYVRGQN